MTSPGARKTDLYEGPGLRPAQEAPCAPGTGTYETKAIESVDEEGLSLIGALEL